nr:pilus assembly protein [Pseudorhodoferax sp. Leaf267]
MVVVLLSSLLALWSFRSSLVNESIVGNDADYLRAFEAAQAMIQDAEFDIRGERPDGTACLPDASKPVRCRTGSTVAFIEETKDLGNLLVQLNASATRCIQGICQKRTGRQDFWADDALLTAMTADGARYGDYTGAMVGTASNPILKDTAAGRGAWYWIEVMPYDTSVGGAVLAGKAKLDLNLNPGVVYRITAVARGQKPRTQAVLQSTLARQKLRD